jgi:hypothetical protein
MKPHYHHDFIGVFVTALEVALIFHGIRFIAARAATSDNKMVATAGAAVGGAFTFSGAH